MWPIIIILHSKCNFIAMSTYRPLPGPQSFFNAKTNKGICDLCFVPKSERQKAIVGFVPEST